MKFAQGFIVDAENPAREAEEIIYIRIKEV